MKKSLLTTIILFFGISLFSNPVSMNALDLDEEQVWIEVGPDVSEISGTFFFKLGKYKLNIYTFHLPVYVPLDLSNDLIKKNTKLKFKAKNTMSTKKILDKKPKYIEKKLQTPESQKVVWYEIKTTEFRGAETAGTEFPDKNDKDNVLHGKHGKLLWREKNSSIPPIKISYTQQNYKEKDGTYFIYMPLIPDDSPDINKLNHGFIHLMPKKGYKLELISKLPKGTVEIDKTGIQVSPENRKPIIVKIQKIHNKKDVLATPKSGK